MRAGPVHTHLMVLASPLRIVLQDRSCVLNASAKYKEQDLFRTWIKFS